jgi:hypothetical protein
MSNAATTAPAPRYFVQTVNDRTERIGRSLVTAKNPAAAAAKVARKASVGARVTRVLLAEFDGRDWTSTGENLI